MVDNIPIYKCYFRCFVVSPSLRLHCSVLRMKAMKKMHCSLYFNVIVHFTSMSSLFQYPLKKNGKHLDL